MLHLQLLCHAKALRGNGSASSLVMSAVCAGLQCKWLMHIGYHGVTGSDEVISFFGFDKNQDYSNFREPKTCRGGLFPNLAFRPTKGKPQAKNEMRSGVT